LSIPRKFYARDTVIVAKDLLGKKLVRKIGNKTISGIITETEAYRQSDDAASHAYMGITPRNKAMFGEVGCVYVYFTYGMYYCVNVVARNHKYMAGAVLIRALKPVDGIDMMKKNRKKKTNLTDGPAKLTQALRIDKKLYGEDLIKSSNLFIINGVKKTKIISSTRIGIKKAADKKWNFKINV